jgi:integrase/recombinase XerD
MAGRQANVLAPAELNAVLRYVRRHHPDPLRSRVMILLSVKAGLRAAEIARLEWSMVLSAKSSVSFLISVPNDIAKKGSGRRIPMHPDLRRELTALLRRDGNVGPVVRSARGGHMTPNSVVNWFISAFRAAGLQGCSSHSGRRTFITQAARLTYKAGGSLRDVQILAGHRSIQTTEAYITGSEPAQRRLVSLL